MYSRVRRLRRREEIDTDSYCGTRAEVHRCRKVLKSGHREDRSTPGYVPKKLACLSILSTSNQPQELDKSRTQGIDCVEWEYDAAGGKFYSYVFGWMLHVYPHGQPRERIWAHESAHLSRNPLIVITNQEMCPRILALDLKHRSYRQPCRRAKCGIMR